MKILLYPLIRLQVVLLFVVVLFACHGPPAHVPSDPMERVVAGDRVKLMRELTVPADRASVTLQNGRLAGGFSIDRFDASCRFVMMKIGNTPQTIEPGEFLVTEVSYWEELVGFGIRVSSAAGEMITYEITLQLQSEQQPQVHSLVCAHDDDHNDGLHLRFGEMQNALGDFARIIKSRI